MPSKSSSVTKLCFTVSISFANNLEKMHQLSNFLTAKSEGYYNFHCVSIPSYHAAVNSYCSQSHGSLLTSSLDRFETNHNSPLEMTLEKTLHSGWLESCPKPLVWQSTVENRTHCTSPLLHNYLLDLCTMSMCIVTTTIFQQSHLDSALASSELIRAVFRSLALFQW